MRLIEQIRKDNRKVHSIGWVHYTFSNQVILSQNSAIFHSATLPQTSVKLVINVMCYSVSWSGLVCVWSENCEIGIKGWSTDDAEAESMHQEDGEVCDEMDKPTSIVAMWKPRSNQVLFHYSHGDCFYAAKGYRYLNPFYWNLQW